MSNTKQASANDNDNYYIQVVIPIKNNFSDAVMHYIEQKIYNETKIQFNIMGYTDMNMVTTIERYIYIECFNKNNARSIVRLLDKDIWDPLGKNYRLQAAIIGTKPSIEVMGPRRRLFITRVSSDIDKQQIESLFKQCGDIEDIFISKKHSSKYPNVYLSMGTSYQAQQVMDYVKKK
jgi:hypothetical protein